MDVSLFDFALPESLIALRPAEPRESAKLLAVDDGLNDSTLAQFPGYLRAGDVLVVNDTKVFPARLKGRVGGTTVEILLHQQAGALTWRGFAKPAKKLKIDSALSFAENFSAHVVGKEPDGQVLLSFDCAAENFHTLLAQHGLMPLPPYIEKKRPADAQDAQDYQTRYATHTGSVAAPTAGLHLTEALLNQLREKGVSVVKLTLHIGAGTFQPVKVQDTAEHVMHGEWLEVTSAAANEINEARAAGGRIIAVGTTSLRSLEAASDATGKILPYTGETRIFITPGTPIRTADMLLTNFHLPKSTLFMLVSAFCGLEVMQTAYKHAIENRYRFYSYGDACLLFKKTVE